MLQMLHDINDTIVMNRLNSKSNRYFDSIDKMVYFEEESDPDFIEIIKICSISMWYTSRGVIQMSDQKRVGMC